MEDYHLDYPGKTERQWKALRLMMIFDCPKLSSVYWALGES